MNTFRYRVWPVLLILLTGCTDCAGKERRDLNRQRDLLIQRRGILAIQQAQLQIAIRNDLGGRPPETLSKAEREVIRTSLRGQQLAAVTWQLQNVDQEIESVQNQLGNMRNRTTP